jgi:hypothetical protein
MEDRPGLRLQYPRDDRLGDPVPYRGDGAFILPLLQSGVWMFLFVIASCAGRAALADLVM